MPLKKQVISTTFGVGVDAGTAPTITAGPITAKNVTINYKGEYRKRSGQSRGGTSYNSDVILVPNGGTAYTLGSSPSDIRHTIRDVTVKRFYLPGADSVLNMQYATTSSSSQTEGATMFTTSTGLVFRGFEDDALSETSTDTTAESAKIIRFSDTLVALVYVEPGSPDTMRVASYTPPNNSYSVSGTTYSMSSAATNPSASLLDVCLCNDGSNDVIVAAVSYRNTTSGFDEIKLVQIDFPTVSFTVLKTYSNGSANVYKAGIWRQSTNEVGVIYEDGAGSVDVEAYNVSTASSSWTSTGVFSVAAANINTLGGSHSGASSAVCILKASNDTVLQAASVSSGSSTSSTNLVGVIPAGKPFTDSSDNVYFPVIVYDSGEGAGAAYTSPQATALQRRLLIVNSSQEVVADLGDAWENTTNLADIEETDTDVFSIPVIRGQTKNGQRLEVYTLDLSGSFSNKPDAVEFNGDTYVYGQLPIAFDRSDYIEESFFKFPEFIGASGASSGSALSAGTYSYVAVYEHRDARGNLLRSSPTLTPATVNLTSADTVNVVIPNIPYTIRNGVSAAIYRTTAGGATYYRVGSIALAAMPTTTVTFNDSVSDSNLSTNEVLYTTGGTVINEFRLPGKIAAAHDGRVFYVEEGESGVVRYSKRKKPETSLEISRVLTIDIPEGGGDIVALSPLYDKLIVLSEKSIYAIEGNGFNDNLTGTNYTVYLVAQGVGCNNRRSVVLTPKGLMFQSKKQIYILDNALNVIEIGAPVKYYNDNVIQTGGSVEIEKAVALQDISSAVFVPNDASAIAQVYNWEHNAWTTWSGYDSQDALEIGSLIVRIDKSDGYIYTEERDLFQDNSSDYNVDIRTGAISPHGIGGYGRLYSILIIGQKRVAGPSIKVSIKYDNVGDFDESITYDLSNIDHYDWTKHFETSTGNDSPFILKYYPARTKATSYWIKIEDVAGTGGDSFSIAAISLEVGAYDGVNRTPDTRQM